MAVHVNLIQAWPTRCRLLTSPLAETGWIYVKELILRSSNVLYYKIEPDMLFNFFDIIEDTIVNQTRLRTVKL